MNKFNQPQQMQQNRQLNIIMRLVDILHSPDFGLLDMDMLLSIVGDPDGGDTIQERCEKLSEGLQQVADSL